MSIDWRRTLKKDGLANGWEWGGIKEFVTKKILPVKGGRHQDLSISKKQPPCHDFGWSRGQVFISLAIVSKWAISFQMEMFLTYIFSTISYQCNLLPLDLAGKKNNWLDETSILHNIICVNQENNAKVIFWDVFLFLATTTRSSHSLIFFKAFRKIPNF